MVEVLLLPPGKSVEKKRKYKGNNAFGVLGVPPQSSMRTIKHAYLELASQYHPDKNSSSDAMGCFIKINQAYKFIIKGGDLARYLALCDIVPLKQEYSESLRNIKRIEVLTGISVPVPEPSGEVSLPKEVLNKQIRLVTALLFKCPGCKWKGGCDTATGFGDVESIHKERFEKLMQQAVNTSGRSGK